MDIGTKIMEPCEACSRKLTDMTGHDNLYLHTFVAGGMLFKCRSCHTIWRRDYPREGDFAWTAAEATQGRLPPARSSS